MSATLRPFALVQGGDSWSRASHAGTFLSLEDGIVELAWSPPDEEASPPGPPPLPAGLAFDAGCRLYRSDPAAGMVERSLWKVGRPFASAPTIELFENEPAGAIGDFTPAEAPGGPLLEPRGLAVDVDDRLFVAETGRGRVLVYDLWSRRLLRTIKMPAGTRPLDLAVQGRTIYATLDGSDALLRFTARGDIEPVILPPEALVPTRVAVAPGTGEIAVLVGAGTEDALIVPIHHPHDVIAVPRATDIEWESDNVIVAARFPGESFVRHRMTSASVEVILPLIARGYDGRGIVRTPDGRIGFNTSEGFRLAVAARVRYVPNGSVTTYRLDSGDYQTRWGRLFIDACVTNGTSIRLRYITSDESLDGPTMPRTPPANLVSATIRRPDLSPPMPLLTLVDDEGPGHVLHRRETGREQAWLHPGSDDVFVTYEAPVLAEPGRYLWVTLELKGTRRISPKFRSLRVESVDHDYLRRLPATFSRHPLDADFLRRYLALFHGLIDEVENRAAHRQILLDPFATPQDMLPWLASFLGLALDERWPVAARRELIAEAAWLFRFRGTIRGLSRFLEIYLSEPVIILEHFRMRGMGGAIVGDRGPVESRAILGGGFRVGGLVGDPHESPLEGTPADAFMTHAHRFSVLIQGVLDDEQLEVVRHVLELHRPAHTIFDICQLGAGMRVGRGLHVGISSGIGPTGGFQTLQLGAASLGRGAVIGRAETATIPEASRLGKDSRVG